MDKQKNTRRPTGFATAGQAQQQRRAPSSAASSPNKAAPKKTAAPKKEAPVRSKRSSNEYKPGRGKKILTIAIIVAVLVGVLAIIIANSGKTYHYLPTVQLKTAEADFTPESTPLPTAEGL